MCYPSQLLAIYASSCRSFNCELNFIELFGGAVKKYLWDNCDCTFNTLKKNLPKALDSVPFVRGNIRCTGGWKLTRPDWGLQRPRFKSGNSAQKSISPSLQDCSLCLWPMYIQCDICCYKVKLTPNENYFSLNFDLNNNHSWDHFLL